jgi:undecaprenyl-diphosphatase
LQALCFYGKIKPIEAKGGIHMTVLYWLEAIRNPVLDFLFSIITLCGEETVFMAVGMAIFWCINKYDGYYLLCTGFFGTIINQFLKITCRIPRPWVKDPGFTIVESAREAAGGYSFPSGHTQVSVGLFGGIGKINKNRIVRGIMIALCVLVPFSRMYLGVHTPWDVGVSVCIALILVFGLHPLFKRAEKDSRVMYGILGLLSVLVVAYLLYVTLWRFPESVYLEENIHNLESAQKNAYTLLGCMAGLLVLYPVETKWIRFETKAVWWVQILKVVFGLLLIVMVKELLKAPLDALCAGHLISRSIRYFFVVIVGGILWPLTFRFFAKMGKKS